MQARIIDMTFHSSQTPPNNVTPQLGQAQLALLQQLALTAKLGNTVQLQPALFSSDQARAPLETSSDRSTSSSQSLPGTHPRSNLHPGDPRSSDTGHAERLKSYNERRDDRVVHRGGHRDGYRGRRNRWEGDRFHRDPPSRPRDNRSRSPRRLEGRGMRQYSPPRRRASGKEPSRTELSSPATPEGGKDEFGRDLRPSSVTPPRPVSSEDIPTQAPVVPSVVPDSAAAPHCRIPVPDQLPSVAANTPAQSTDTHASSSAASEQRGLDQFDISTFDATAPSSWEALGNMWKTTYDYIPSQEELMQFILAGGMALAGAAGCHYGDSQSRLHRHEGAGQGLRGKGRGSVNGGQRQFGHDDYGEAGQWEQSNAEYTGTDAIVLGESAGAKKEEDQCSDGYHDLTLVKTQARGGRMQRIGDKWLFVRDPVS